jgi:phage anti-repressor protein
MESSIEFNKELALSLYKSSEEFPVEFSKAIEWLGYTRKDSAKEKLTRNFEKGIDYSVEWRNVPHSKGSGASRVEEIFLTVDTFKSLGMMVGTEKGKEIRKYFLECEKVAKRVTDTINPALLEVLGSMQKEMKRLAERTEKLDSMERATNNNKGIKGVIDTEIDDIYPSDISFTVKEYLDFKGVDLRHLHTLRKRAIQFYRNGTQEVELPKRGSEVLFKGANVGYLDQALKTVLGLD